MFWNACDCGHTSENHYRSGMSREGGCKERGCACKGFVERTSGR
jgi:hypothetical protein